MEFHVLGPVGARIDGVEVGLDGAKQRTVLAALLLSENHLVPDSRLSTALYGWNPPTTASAQIYNYVSRIRKHLEPGVEITRMRPGYLLRAGDSWFDHIEFERLAVQGRAALQAGAHEQAATSLRAALVLWRGPALADVSEHLAASEGPRLDEARLTVLEDCAQAELALGRHRQLVPELTALVAAEPLRERLRDLLMTALYRCERQADALRVYHEGRRLLSQKLGVDPGVGLDGTYPRHPARGTAPAVRTGVLQLAGPRDAPARHPRPRRTGAGGRRDERADARRRRVR
jgi:SARP family transcriptional regulator, regulator of embCAB operon